MAVIDGRTFVIDEAVRTVTQKHCFSRVDVEVGGFLLGNITAYGVNVVASQPAETAESGQTQLTFTHEAWDEVLGKMETEFAGMEIVGWYHSHPGFGCFLSDYDIFIQENFFSSDGQHALVIDPVAGEYAVFTAAAGKSKTITSGKTDLPALGKNLEDLSGNEARAALIEEQLTISSPGQAHRSGNTVVKVLGVVVLLLLSGGVGWFVGSLQGRDTERASANAVLSDVQSELAATQSNLATAQEELANQQVEVPLQPENTTESATENTTPPIDPVLTLGSRATVDVDYQIRSGDSLWLISQRFLGDGEKFPKLLKWNPTIKETGLIPGATIVLRVPATIVSGEE